MSAPPPQPLPLEESSFPPLRYAQFVVLVLTLVYTASFLDRQIIALTAERVRADLALSDVQLGLLQGLSFAIFYTALGIPMGILADRTSRRRLILCGLILWSIATALCGFASSFSALFLARMLVGVGEAALAPAAYSLISDYFPRRSRGRAMSVYASGVLIGSGLAYMAGAMILPLADRVAQWLLESGFRRNGWQVAFMLAATPGLVLPLLLLAVREPARQERVSGETLQAGASWKFIVGRWRYFATVYAALSLMAAVNFGNFAWLPSVFQRVHGRSASDFGYGFGLILLILGPLGMLAGGALADHLRSRRPRSPVLAICGIALLLSTPAAALSPVVTDIRIAWLLVGWQIFSVSVPISLGPVALQLAAPNEFRGFVMALYMVSISIVGLGLGPLIPAIVSDHLFADSGMIGIALALQCALLLPVAGVALLRLARSDEAQTARRQ
jgi:MFS family permease